MAVVNIDPAPKFTRFLGRLPVMRRASTGLVAVQVEPQGLVLV